VFVIEDEHRIVVITSDGLQFYAARSDAGTRFGQIVLDPQFADSGLMYVSEIDAGFDGSQEFRVVRHRVVENQAQERTVIISLPLASGAGDAVFAAGTAGHIYVAVPSAANGHGRTAYSGMLLRFNADGTVPNEQQGSPLFATGYVHPSAIVLDEQTQRLWLAGVDDDERASVSSLGESTSPLLAPAVSLAVSDADGQHYLLAASDDGGFGRAQVEADGSLSASSQLAIELGPIRGVAVNAEGDLFVAVDQPTRFGTTTLVVRLTPIQQR
jgi:glucose/arabinose dehydrogenase